MQTDIYVYIFRTARGCKSGLALSFVDPSEKHLLDSVEAFLQEQLSAQDDEDGVVSTESLSRIIKPYILKVKLLLFWIQIFFFSDLLLEQCRRNIYVSMMLTRYRFGKTCCFCFYF